MIDVVGAARIARRPSFTPFRERARLAIAIVKYLKSHQPALSGFIHRFDPGQLFDPFDDAIGFCVVIDHCVAESAQLIARGIGLQPRRFDHLAFPVIDFLQDQLLILERFSAVKAEGEVLHALTLHPFQMSSQYSATKQSE